MTKSEMTMAELEARKATIIQQLEVLRALADDPAGQGLINERKAELARVSRKLDEKRGVQFREVLTVTIGEGQAALIQKRKLAAVEVVDTATWLPFGSHMPNVLLTSGLISGLDRATLHRYLGRDAAVRNVLIPLNSGRPNEYVKYSGPVMAREDRDVIRALMAIASEHALGADDAEVPSGYITVTARELMASIGYTSFSTKSRRAVVESVLRWSEVQLSMVEMSPGSRRVADAKEITGFVRLINLSRITQDLGSNAAEITFSVPRSAAKLYGYRDFSKIESHYELPPLVSFIKDYLQPHKDGWIVKASTVWQASQSQGTFENFVRARLNEAFAWFIGQGHVVEKQMIDDEALALEDGAEGFRFRITKPSKLPDYDARLEARKHQRGDWFRYMPRVRRTQAEMAEARANQSVH